MRIFKITAAFTVVGLAAACAKAPDSIAAAYVSPTSYQSFSCAQLAQEQVHLADAYSTAAAQQEHARTNDIVGVVLIGLPVSSLSGDNIAPQIADLKGHQEAVRQEMIAKRCSSPTPTAQVRRRLGA